MPFRYVHDGVTDPFDERVRWKDKRHVCLRQVSDRF